MDILIKTISVIINWQEFSSMCWTNVYCSQDFVNGLHSDLNEKFNNNTHYY